MAQNLLELTSSIVSAHASMSEMTGDELLQEIQRVYTALQQLESAAPADSTQPTEAKTPTVTLKKAFQADQVVCMICGKGGMKTLTRHLTKVHNMKPGEYRKQFGIPRTQSLTAKNFSEARRQMANERGLAETLVKARAIRASNAAAKAAAKTAPKKTEKPVKTKPARAQKTTKAK
jgi:predicted transcriptional regulator